MVISTRCGIIATQTVSSVLPLHTVKLRYLRIIPIYLGVVIQQSDSDNTSEKDKWVSRGVLVGSIIITVLAGWYIWYKMSKARPYVAREWRRRHALKKAEAGEAGKDTNRPQKDTETDSRLSTQEIMEYAQRVQNRDESMAHNPAENINAFSYTAYEPAYSPGRDDRLAYPRQPHTRSDSSNSLNRQVLSTMGTPHSKESGQVVYSGRPSTTQSSAPTRLKSETAHSSQDYSEDGPHAL